MEEEELVMRDNEDDSSVSFGEKRRCQEPVDVEAITVNGMEYICDGKIPIAHLREALLRVLQLECVVPSSVTSKRENIARCLLDEKPIDR